MGIEQGRGAGRFNRPGPLPVEPPRGRIYIALDTESTGVEADSGEVIEVAAIKFRLEAGGKTKILDRWETYVKPKNPIPYKITQPNCLAASSSRVWASSIIRKSYSGKVPAKP